MTQYNVTISATYQCRDESGFTLELSDTLFITVEGNSPDDDYGTAVEAAIRANAPPNCVADPIYTYTVEPAAVAENPNFPVDAPAYSETGEYEGVSNIVTVHGLAVLQCANGEVAYRTVRVDVLDTQTRAEVMDALEGVAEELISSAPDSYPCVIDHVDIVAPAFFHYLSE